VNIRTGSYDERYRFGGHIKDEESGLSYMHARYLDNDIGPITPDAYSFNTPHLTPYNHMGNNPIKYVDSDGNILRDAQTGQIIFTPLMSNMSLSGGFEGTMPIQGTFGYVVANDGITKMDVIRVHSYKKDWNDDWRRITDTELHGSLGTNCVGTNILDGQYLPINQGDLIPFLFADGFSEMDAIGKQYQIGDLLVWYGGAHMIKAVDKDKNGNLVWESRWMGDSYIQRGSLSQILEYHDMLEGGEYAGQIDKHTKLYRRKAGDVYKKNSDINRINNLLDKKLNIILTPEENK
jgi:RHS repeat-associated protein